MLTIVRMFVNMWMIVRLICKWVKYPIRPMLIVAPSVALRAIFLFYVVILEPYRLRTASRRADFCQILRLLCVGAIFSPQSSELYVGKTQRSAQRSFFSISFTFKLASSWVMRYVFKFARKITHVCKIILIYSPAKFDWALRCTFSALRCVFAALRYVFVIRYVLQKHDKGHVANCLEEIRVGYATSTIRFDNHVAYCKSQKYCSTRYATGHDKHRPYVAYSIENSTPKWLALKWYLMY